MLMNWQWRDDGAGSVILAKFAIRVQNEFVPNWQ